MTAHGSAHALEAVDSPVFPRLPAAEERLQLALAVAHLGTFVWYPTEERIEADAQMLALFGLPVGGTHLLDTALTTLIHPADRTRYAAAVAYATSPTGSGRLEEEIRVVHPDGTEHWLGITGQTYCAGGTPDRPLRMVGIAADITERKRQEANVRFLADLAAACAPLTSPAALMQTAGARIGAFLQVQYCHFLAMDEGSDEVVYLDHWQAAGVPPLPDQAHLVPPAKQAVYPVVRAGNTLVNHDTQTPPLWDAVANPGLPVRAFITVPIHQGGAGKGLFSVYATQPRVWRTDEIGLVQELAQRLFPHLERTRTEEALRNNEARFRQVWETSADALVLSDAQGIVLDANPAYYALYGLTSAEVLGHSFAQVFPPAARAAAEAEYQQVFTGPAALAGFEARVQRRDGTQRNVDARATFLTTAGRRSAMLSTLRDITERKQAEERLHALYQVSEAVNRVEALEEIYEVALHALERVLHVNRAAILLLDTAGVMRFQAWHGLSATYRQQVEGHSPWAHQETQPVLVADVASADLGALRSLLQTEGIGALAFIPLVEQERMLGKFMLYYDQPHTFTAAEVQLALTLARHVAHALQRKQAEQALHQLNQTLEQRVYERTLALERRNQELDQFAYVASHDLKAPLRSIQHLASWISADAAAVLPAAAQSHLAKLRGRVQRMEKLLDDLLLYSRAGRHPYSQEQVNTTELVRNIIELLAPPPGFCVLVDAALPPLVTERIPLEVVLRNLIDNAIKHHDRPQAGQLHLTASTQEVGILFSVHDNGPGISPEFHERIFQLFQTLQPRDQVEGSGMGLAVVKKLVEYRGGWIQVESSRGQGTTFRFLWPTTTMAP